jgi:hypothetical protein
MARRYQVRLHDMAHRAFNWSLTVVETGGTAEEFFRELERAHMIRIEQPMPAASG